MLSIPSHVHLECAHTDPRSGPRSRQPDEVLAADVAGEEGGADLLERQREIMRGILIPSQLEGNYLQEARTCVCRRGRSR